MGDFSHRPWQRRVFLLVCLIGKYHKPLLLVGGGLLLYSLQLLWQHVRWVP